MVRESEQTGAGGIAKFELCEIDPVICFRSDRAVWCAVGFDDAVIAAPFGPRGGVAGGVEFGFRLECSGFDGVIRAPCALDAAGESPACIPVERDVRLVGCGDFRAEWIPVQSWVVGPCGVNRKRVSNLNRLITPCDGVVGWKLAKLPFPFLVVDGFYGGNSTVNGGCGDGVTNALEIHVLRVTLNCTFLDFKMNIGRIYGPVPSGFYSEFRVSIPPHFVDAGAVGDLELFGSPGVAGGCSNVRVLKDERADESGTGFKFNDVSWGAVDSTGICRSSIDFHLILVGPLRGDVHHEVARHHLLEAWQVPTAEEEGFIQTHVGFLQGSGSQCRECRMPFVFETRGFVHHMEILSRSDETQGCRAVEPVGKIP